MTSIHAQRRRRSALLGGYLAADLLSLLGNAIVMVALPLIVLATTGSPASTGIVMVATVLPSIVAGIVGGVVVDRFDRRRVSIASDLMSAGSVAALPVVDHLWGLGLGWFILLGMIGAFGDLPGMAAREALAPAVAVRAGLDLERLTGLREALGAGMMVAGPAVAGLLIWLLPGATVLWVTAAASAAAALVTLALPRAVGDYARTAPGARGPVHRSLEGFRLIAADVVLRDIMGITFVLMGAVGALQMLVLPAHLGAIGRPELLGGVLSGLAAGMLIGAGLYAALPGRLSAAAWFRSGVAGATAGLAVVSLLPPLPVMIGAAVLAGVGVGPASAVASAVVVRRLHEGTLGRVLGAQNTLMMAAGPLLLVPIAVVAEAASVRAAGVVLALVTGLAAAVVLRSRGLAFPAGPPSAPDAAEGPA